jgi:hypothetical protein
MLDKAMEKAGLRQHLDGPGKLRLPFRDVLGFLPGPRAHRRDDRVRPTLAVILLEHFHGTEGRRLPRLPVGLGPELDR